MIFNVIEKIKINTKVVLQAYAEGNIVARLVEKG